MCKLPKRAMTQTMGELGKKRPRPSERDSFRASRTKRGSTSKIRPMADPVRRRLASLHSVGSELTSAVRPSESASLRSVQTETRNLRRGNDAWRKGWKTQTPSFPPFPPRLEIRQKAPDSHISTASAAAISHYPKLSRSPPHLIRISLTDADHFDQDPSASVASLRR
jgi:hypothetical protein